MNRRFLAVLLAALFLMAIFASCGKTENTGGPTGGNNPVSPGTGGDNQYKYIDENGKELWKIQVEPFDWGGREFVILVRDEGGTNVYNDMDFTYSEAKEGEPVNDAAFRRILEIEEMFGVKIKTVGGRAAGYDPTRTALLRASILSDDKAYDITMNCPRNNGVLSQEGAFYNLTEFPNIDLSEPWWDKNWVDNATIAGKIYQAAGDLSLAYKHTAAVIFFNKQMITDLGLPSPYNLVAENKWTIDQVIEMSKAVWENYNPEGLATNVMNVIGVGGYNATLSQALSGCGIFIIEKDKDDIPVPAFYSERMLSAFEKVTDLLFERNLFYNYQLGYASARGGVTKFQNNELLFFWNEMYHVLALRQMDTDFGILPSPKYNSDQPRYYQQINMQESMVLAIPKYSNPGDLANIGAIVSAMAVMGKNYMPPAYYDVTLKGKVTRDEESEAMLDLIYDSILIDNGRMYDTGGISNGLNDVSIAQNRDIASWFAARETVLQTAIDKMVDSYLSLD